VKLPRQHVVGEVDIQIVVCSDEDMADAEAEAMYTVASGEPIIKMKKGLRGNYRHLCQLHEWSHAVIDLAEIRLEAETEERLVGAFASAALRLLKDVQTENKPRLQLCESCATLLAKRKDITMLSRQEGPIAKRDEARNWIFTEEIFKAYKHDLPTKLDEIQPGLKFQFFNGPYGGGRKFEVVDLHFSGFGDDPIALTAKDA
jgi:hypothetical protein